MDFKSRRCAGIIKGKIMTDTIKKNHKISGNGVISISGDVITISVKDKGDYNLATLLFELDGRDVEFNFSYDETI